MTSHDASKKHYLSLGAGGDGHKEERRAEFVENIAVLDSDEDGVRIEPLSLSSQAGMTNNETTADLASNVTVTSGAKCNAVFNETSQLAVDSDGICDDDGDYRRQEDTSDKKGLVSCGKAHTLEQENDARRTSSNNPEDLNSVSSLHPSASSLTQPLPGIRAPSSNRTSPHCETRPVCEDARMSAPETCSPGQFPTLGPNLEQATVTLKKYQDRNKDISENESIKNKFLTGYQSANVESCMRTSPPHFSRESSLGISSIGASTRDNLALASVQLADGDSSRIFTPDVASSKGICSGTRVAGRSGSASEIPDYPRRFKQDSLLSPGSTSQRGDNSITAFAQQHSSNNCSLISADNVVSPTCEYFGGSSNIVSSIRNSSQDKDNYARNQRDTQLLDEEHSHPCHSSDVYDSQACQLVRFHADEGHKSSNQEVLKDDRTIQVSDVVAGRGHILQPKQSHCLHDGLPLTSRFQASPSPARTAVTSDSRHPWPPESSTSRFSLPSSYSSPAIVNAESRSLLLLNSDTDHEFNNYDRISNQIREGRWQTKYKSAGGKLESGVTQPGVSQSGVTQPGVTRPEVFQPGVSQFGVSQPGVTQPGVTQPGVSQPGASAESTSNIVPNVSCSSSAITEPTHPFIQLPGVTDSSTSVNAGFSEPSTTGYNYMRFQESNNNFYSRLGDPYSDNPSPRISRSTLSRLFAQRRHGSAPDVSLRTCSLCNHVDLSRGLPSTTRLGAPEEDSDDDLQSENQLHSETTSHNNQPDFPETGDIFDSLLSVLVDKAASDQNINTCSSATQGDHNDRQRSALFYKDAQGKYTCEEGNHKESHRNTRLGRVHKKNLSHSRMYSGDTPNIPISRSTATPCMAQIHAEAHPCLTAPAIRITTSTLCGDASQSSSADTLAQTALSPASSSPAPGTEIYSAVNALHRPRVSFINGLRRLSREKTAFLRVEQPCSNTLRTPSSATQCAEKQDEYETGRAGKRFGRDNKRRLKVEFAIMDTDSDHLAHNKRPGNISSGFISIKDDVENDVAMLGGGGGRFRHPRVSLLGKPLNYKAHRRDVSYRRLQARIYNFLERPKSWQSWIYHLAMFLFVLLCLTLGVLSSITEFEKLLLQYAVYLEIVMLLWIVLELGLRVWSAGCRSRYQGQSGRLRFLRRPLCIIDMILVMASVSSLIVGSTQEHFSQAVLSGLRFFQILRMVRMDRKGGTWKLLGSVVWAHRQELVTTLYIGLLGLVFSSYFVYLAEKDQPRLENSPKRQFNHTEYNPKFSNFADAIWWGVVTLCTVGYGDVVPATWGGKVIASFSAILGISFFALPAGILGSGFALKVQQQQRQKHLNRRRIPAANLIQCLWRCYAADELSMSTATWKRHLIPCPSPPSERTFKNNTSFVSRFSTRRRDRSNATGSFSRDGIPSHSPMTARHHSRRSAISTSEEEVTNVMDRSHLCLATGATEQKYQLDTIPFKKENSMTSIGKESEEEDLSPRLTQLTEQHKRIIRVIRKIRYFVSRRKFREALRPYDVKDVIEQYSAGHIDMLARIKNLQGRLDQILGRQGSKSKDVYESKICLASRIVKVERQVEDIETKLDMLLDMYKDDRKLLLQHLNISQTGALQVGPSHPPPPPPAPSSQFKPRPILIDKQFTSEPATPTGIGFASSPRGRLHGIKPVIQRNLSDLSQRIKKRVTYRGLYLQDPPSRAQSAANFASIQPSTFPAATPVPTTTSPDEMSSTTVSETTRDESSENIISLNDVDLPLVLGIMTPTEESQQEASSSAEAGCSDSAASLYNTEETYFFSNSNLYPGLKSIQQTPISPSPVNSPLIRVKILSTLNEQTSLESDTSQSCTSSPPPTPPTNKTAANISRNTPPSSVHQSPLIQRQRHFSGTDNTSQSQKSSPLTSRRSHKSILRLPSALASTVASSEDFTTTNTSPQSLTTSNYANSTPDVFFQTEDTSKLCNMEDDSTEIGGLTNRSCKTSEL